MHIDLSHDITNGMETYPGLPTPVIGSHLTREAAEVIYGPGITFQIGWIEICTNTGTYLDVPFHRFADIPIIEHLTNLAAVPADGFSFTAVPPKIEGAGTFTVRAFARSTETTSRRCPIRSELFVDSVYATVVSDDCGSEHEPCRRCG